MKTSKYKVVFEVKTKFHKSFIKKKLAIHGELYEEGVGKYIVFNGIFWHHTDFTFGKKILKPFDAGKFIKKHGAKAGPDPKFMHELMIEEAEIEMRKTLKEIFNAKSPY